MLESIQKEPHLRGFVEQISSASSTERLFNIMAIIVAGFKKEDAKKYQGRNIDEILSSSDNANELKKWKDVLETVKQECVMSRFPVQHLEDEQRQGKINPSVDCMIKEEIDYVLYTKKELKSAIKAYLGEVLAVVKVNSPKDLPLIPIDPPKNITHELRRLKVCKDGFTPASLSIENLDIVAANTEVLKASLVDDKTYFREKKGVWSLQEGKNIVFYRRENNGRIIPIQTGNT